MRVSPASTFLGIPGGPPRTAGLGGEAGSKEGLCAGDRSLAGIRIITAHDRGGGR